MAIHEMPYCPQIFHLDILGNIVKFLLQVVHFKLFTHVRKEQLPKSIPSSI